MPNQTFGGCWVRSQTRGSPTTSRSRHFTLRQSTRSSGSEEQNHTLLSPVSPQKEKTSTTLHKSPRLRWMTASVGFAQGEPASSPQSLLGICTRWGNVQPSPRSPLSSSLIVLTCRWTLLCTQTSWTGSSPPSLRWSGRIISPCPTSRFPSGPAGPRCHQTSRSTHLKGVRRRSSFRAGSWAATAPHSSLGTPRAPTPPTRLKPPPMQPLRVYRHEFFGVTTCVLTLETVKL